MKKRIISLALAVLLGLSLTACNKPQADTTISEPPAQSAMVDNETRDPQTSEDSSAKVDMAGGDAGDVQTSASSGEADANGYFVTVRLNRQQVRDSALSLLQDAAARNDYIQKMAKYTAAEAQIEKLVVTEGYTDCVVYIEEDALSLAVSAPEGGLTEADIAKILDIVTQTTSFTAEQIRIIEVEVYHDKRIKE